MSDKVTYSTLELQAKITNRTVEEVAKQDYGMSEAALMELKLGGDPGKNEDVASFENAKGYRIKLPNGYEFLIKSTTGFNDNTAKFAELSDNIAAEIKANGYELEKVEDGYLFLKGIEDGKTYKVLLNETRVIRDGGDLGEVVVNGHNADDRKYINAYGNAFATQADVSAGEFAKAYDKVSDTLNKMTDEQKSETMAAASELIQAIENGDVAKRDECVKTINDNLGSVGAGSHASQSGLLKVLDAVGVCAVVAWLDKHTPEQIKEAIGFVGEFGGGMLKSTAQAVVMATGILASCKEDDEEFKKTDTIENNTNINIKVSVVQDNMSVVEGLLSSIAFLMEQNLAYTSQIGDLKAELEALRAELKGYSDKSAAELEALNDKIQQLIEEVQKCQGQLATIIINQESAANTAEEYYKLILAAVQNNGETNKELLKTVIGLLTQGNNTLTLIKSLMEQNNAIDEEILEAITKCKYGIDQLHEDNQKIQNLLVRIQTAIANLPKELEATFKPYFKAIILGIADNGAKLDALTKLVTIINKNIVAGNNTLAMAIAKLTAKVDELDLAKVEKLLEEILNKMGDDAEKLYKLLETINSNVAMNGERQERILEAINKLAAFGVKITGQIDTIINLIGNDSAKLDALINLLEQMDANDEERNQKILDAIQKLNCDMVTGFATLIALAKKNNDLTEETNNLIDIVIDLMKTFPNVPGSNVDLTAVIAAINKNTDAINAQGGDIKAWLKSIYELLKTLNGNVVEGNATNNALLCKILKAIEDLDADCVAGFNAIIVAIGNKTSDGVDLSWLEDKLDAILQAIKDHKVKIVIENNCAQQGDNVNEGEIDDVNQWVQDLNSLLG